ncbi:MAG: phosphate ABC transporter permease subunit PstC [Actinobacteria bacterium]|nr:phosphate ABC transporter permease subunit PstC [Actinomycetota bacterium]MBW3650885.1 phosphate ABC transporter permease subunit PstC [Actinomycetota bacterium]
MAIPLQAPDIGIARRRSRPGERVIVGLLALCGLLSVLVTVGIVLVLAGEAARFFAKVPIVDFLTGTRWAPSGGRVDAGEFGVLPLINGSLMIAAGSLLVGLPLGLATAVYLSEYAPARVRGIVKPVLEILAGIPTVVVGFFALNFITPSLLRPVFGEGRVFIFNAAAGAIAVGLMILPVIASISEDAMRAVPNALREAAFGMGASRRVVALRVVMPAALSGITASVILGVSRAVGETMAVTIAAGNTPRLTTNFFESIQTLTAYIAQTVSGEAAAGSTRYQSLFAVGATLFVITLGMNLLSIRLVRRFRQAYQ